jgi:hypothetical protein
MKPMIEQQQKPTRSLSIRMGGRLFSDRHAHPVSWRVSFCVVTVALLVVSAMIVHAEPLSQARRFPPVTAADLNGRKLALPADFPAKRTIVILAFTQSQQVEVDGWINGMKLKPEAANWLEMPVIDQPGPVGRFFIDNGMRQ